MKATTERRQEMIEFISETRKTSIPELAEKFGIGKRTAVRDLEVLTCSYPIYTVQGKGGGVRAADGWYLSRSYLSDKQEAFLRGLLPGLQPEDKATMNAILTKFTKPICR